MTIRLASISDIAAVNPRQPLLVGGDDTLVPFIPMAAVREDGDDPSEQHRTLGDVGSGYTYFERGDILLAKITPCFENGKTAHLTSLSAPFGFGSTEYHVLRAGPEVDSRYLFQVLRSPRFRHAGALRMTGSAGQRRVPAAFVGRFRIPVPSLIEQRRIAALLDRADAIRRKQHERLLAIESLLASTFSDLFGDPVSNERDWPTTRARDAISGIGAGTSTREVERERMPDDWAVLKISAVTSGWFRPDESKVVDGPPSNPLVPKRGDLLFSRANTRELVAATCLVDRDVERLFLPDKLWRITPNAAVATSEYLRFLLANPRFRQTLTKRATGTSGSMLNVSQEKLLDLTLPLPPLALQQRFAEIVWRSYALRESMLASIDQSDQLQGSIAHQAFAEV